MSITYYVAMPFIDTEDGPAPAQDQAKECQSESGAISAARTLAAKPGHVGAVAFKRSGDPSMGEFSDAEILRTFGATPADGGAL